MRITQAIIIVVIALGCLGIFFMSWYIGFHIGQFIGETLIDFLTMME